LDEKWKSVDAVQKAWPVAALPHPLSPEAQQLLDEKWRITGNPNQSSGCCSMQLLRVDAAAFI